MQFDLEGGHLANLLDGNTLPLKKIHESQKTATSPSSTSGTSNMVSSRLARKGLTLKRENNEIDIKALEVMLNEWYEYAGKGLSAIQGRINEMNLVRLKYPNTFYFRYTV